MDNKELNMLVHLAQRNIHYTGQKLNNLYTFKTVLTNRNLEQYVIFKKRIDYLLEDEINIIKNFTDEAEK